MSICGGADAELETACDDCRVVGLILVNPRSHEPAASLVTIHKGIKYYWNSFIFFIRIWSKALRLRRFYRYATALTFFQLGNFFASEKAAALEARQNPMDLPGIAAKGLDLLLILAEEDLSSDYLQTMLGNEVHKLRGDSRLRVEIIQEADHNFILLARQEDLMKTVRDWIQTRYRDEKVMMCEKSLEGA